MTGASPVKYTSFKNVIVYDYQISMTNLLLLPESQKTNTRHLHDLEAHTGNITLGLSTATETGDEHFIVLVNEVEATIVLEYFSTRLYKAGSEVVDNKVDVSRLGQKII
jgi:adenosyl cobinamide kinase/adenosyl cobinamide phosphate guanylyltransferase